MTAKNRKPSSTSQAEINGTLEKAMNGYGELVALSKENSEALFEATTLASNGIGTITSELMSYSRQALTESLAATRALFEVKSPEEFLHLQTTWLKSASESYVAHLTKLGGLASSTTTEAFKPIQSFATSFAKSARAA